MLLFDLRNYDNKELVDFPDYLRGIALRSAIEEKSAGRALLTFPAEYSDWAVQEKIISLSTAETRLR